MELVWHRTTSWHRMTHSHESLYNHPLAAPVALFPLLAIPPAPPGGARFRSVVNIFIGWRERTSHTATMPSWVATANLELDGETERFAECAGACNGCKFEGESNGGKEQLSMY